MTISIVMCSVPVAAQEPEPPTLEEIVLETPTALRPDGAPKGGLHA